MKNEKERVREEEARKGGRLLFYFGSFLHREKGNLHRAQATGNGVEGWFGNEKRGDDESCVLRPPKRVRRTAVRAGAPSKSVPDCIIERE